MNVNKSDFISQISVRDGTFRKVKNSNEISNVRIIVSQCYATLMLDFLKFTLGSYLGMTTFLVAEFSKKNSEVYFTIDQLSLFGSFCFTTPVGTIVGGILAKYTGSRIVFMIVAFFYVVASFIFYWGTNAPVLLCAQAIVGAVSGINTGPSYTYLAEIAEPRLRNILLGTFSTSELIGTLVTSLLGNFIYWRTLVLMFMIPPILSFGMICFVPESPHWLTNKKKLRKAELSLAWFRGWSIPELVQTEFNSDFCNQRKLSTLADDPLNINNEVSKKQSSFRRALNPYLQRSFLLPLVTLIGVYLVFALCGSSAIRLFATWIFRDINAPIDEQVATTILFAVRTSGAVTFMLIINFCGKRKLLFFSLFGGTICWTILAVLRYLADSKGYDSDMYLWIPTISLIVGMFMFALGIEKVSLIINSEIFPINLRQVSNAIGFAIGLLFSAVMGQSFLYAVAAISLPGVFVAFAIATFIGLIMLYFFLPETDGKSLNEIKELYKIKT